MTGSNRTLVAVMMAVGLAVPSVAAAQRTAPPGSTSSGTAEPRGGGASSGGGGGGGSAAPASTGSASGGGGGSMGTAMPRGSSGNPSAQPVPTRDRNGRPIVGTATTRVLGTVTGLPGPTFGPWGRYFPWYSTGFGWNYGFLQFDPYYGYGYGSYGFGPWFDPFYYDPFNPFGYGYGMFRYGGYGPGYGSESMYYGSGGGSSAPTHLTGSIRLKVSPDAAKVYIDGVLAGTANEFDGLVSHHLTLEGGSHQLELRADGYETYRETIKVEVGKTLTERLSMKKTK